MPLHVTLRFRGDVPRLRNGKAFAIIKPVLAAARERGGLRIVHFSVQSNHIHLIVEANEHTALSRGVQGLAVRLARTLNRLWGRRGKVFADRYHAHALRTPREVRNALSYVLNNARRHGVWLGRGEMDPYASGAGFDGWVNARAHPAAQPPGGLARPRTWLLHVGWRRHGLLFPDEVPARRARSIP